MKKFLNTNKKLLSLTLGLKLNIKNMKKNKRLCKNILFTLLLLISSVNIAWASNLKNNPVSTDKSENDDIYLTGTTFSIANEDSQTDKSYFKLSEVVFGRPIATMEMGNVFQEANGTWNNGGTTDAPRFTILSNPAELSSSYSEKTDKKNRLIFKTPNEDETILKIKVESFKPGSTFAFKVMVEELSGLSGATISMEVNGRTVQGNTLNVSSGRAAIWSPYNEDFQATDLSIEIKLDSGNGAVLAFSDMYIYGELENISISASTNVCNLGENVTLNAISGTGLNLGEVRWQKRTTSPDWFDLIDDAGVPKIGPSVVDTPQAGETCYRAVTLDNAGGSEVYSNEVCVTSEYKCASNSAYIIFTDDFGKLDSETARNSNQYVGRGYSYVAGCGMLKAEGTYAVMANARYGGCNVDGVTDGCGCTNASNDQMWFRDIYDHTQGGVDTEGKYGGMLLVNADAQEVYSRTITLPCANTNLIFSAWFATASKGATSSVRFFVKDSKGKEIKEATFPIEDIDFADGWIKGETSFYTGDETTFTVEIHNYREGTDKGNDFLVDDISFSVCSPEVSLSAQSASNQVVIDGQKSLVEGPCKEPLTLNIQTGMAEAIFNTPQYLWFIKEAGDTEFRHLPNNRNSEVLRTEITPYTQYYVVTTANETDAQSYLDKDAAKFLCTPVAISNTYTVLCAPSMDAYLASQNCNKVLIGATVYDAAFDEIGAWWEKSTDGKNWQKIPRAVYHDTLRYEITEDTYFRLTNSKISSPATEKVLYRGISLTAEPSYGFYGTEVKLTAVTSNFGDMPNGPYYNWQRFEYSDGDWRQIDVDDHTIETINYTIEYPKDSIMVELYGCEATVLLKQVELLIDPMERECNTIRIQPIATIGGESTNYKWQSSSDGKNWVDVLEKNITKLEEPNCPECVEISFSEDCQFRIAAIDENGKETGFYSEAGPDEMLEVKKLELKAEPEIIQKNGGSVLTITKHVGLEGTTAGPEWFEWKDNEYVSFQPTEREQHKHTIASLENTTKYKVVWAFCEASATVTVAQPVKIVVKERECNNVTLEVEAEEGVVLSEYKWQISTFDSESSKWSDWSDYAGYVDKVVVEIDKDTKFQLVGDEISSEPTEAITYWSIELSIDKESIILGEEVTVTVESKYIDASETILWYKNDQSFDYDGDVYTEKPYGPASYQVTQGGCPSDVVNVKEVLWPTIFTPMAVDGFNDDFIIGMEPKVALQVFDRYGNLVVETTDGWDGKYKNGKYALPGVYYYIATLPNGEVVKGNVELLNEKK